MMFRMGFVLMAIGDWIAWRGLGLTRRSKLSEKEKLKRLF